jgi:acetyl esterase/lipase
MPLLRRRRALVPIIALLALVTAGCEQFVAPPGDGLVRYRDLVFAGTTTTPNVLYGTAVNQSGVTVELRLDVYRPNGDTVTERPLIVFVHGGSFRAGTRTSAEIVDEATTFARMGYVTASISYRLSQNGCTAAVPTSECVLAIIHARDDAQDAVSFLRANAATYGIDADRIAIAGTSAGAITALNVAFSNDVDPSSVVRAGVSLSGAALLTQPNAGDAPVFLMHGTADFVVPYQWAVNTQTAATQAGVRAVMTTWEGAGHVPYLAHRQEILDQTRNFLFWHLDLANAAT